MDPGRSLRLQVLAPVVRVGSVIMAVAMVQISRTTLEEVLPQLGSACRMGSKNSRSLDRLVKEREDLKVSLEVINKLTSSLDTQEILYSLLSSINLFVEADRASVILIDEQRSIGRVVASKEDPSITNLTIDLQRYPEILKSFRSRNAVVVENAAQDPLMTGVRDKIAHMATGAILVLPIMIGEEIFGTLFLRASHGKKTFTAREVRNSELISGACANALRNAKLYEDTQTKSRMLETTANKIEGHVKRLSALNRISAEMSANLNLDDLARYVARAIPQTFDYKYCTLFLFDEKDHCLNLKSFSGPELMVVPHRRLSMADKGITVQAALSQKPYYSANVEADENYRPGLPDVKSELAVPIVFNRRLLGVLDVQSPQADAFDEGDKDLLSSIASQFAVCMVNASLFERVEREANTDSLTGLANYRKFHHALRTEIKRSIRQKKPCSLMLIDMDTLKEINDTQGHVGGDRAICTIARILQENCRETDAPARYGGDEFSLVLSETDVDAAHIIANRVRHSISQSQLSPDFKLTVSIGISSFPGLCAVPENLVAHADKALYRAKSLGGDCVVVADRDSDENPQEPAAPRPRRARRQESR